MYDLAYWLLDVSGWTAQSHSYRAARRRLALAGQRAQEAPPTKPSVAAPTWPEWVEGEALDQPWSA